MPKPKPLYELVKLFRKEVEDGANDEYWAAAHEKCADDLETLLKEWHEYLWAEESSDLQAGELRENILGTENLVRQNFQS